MILSFNFLFKFCLIFRCPCHNEHFNLLANRIIEIFSNEDKRIWYIAPKEESELQTSTGKIPEAYRNLLKFLKSINLVDKKIPKNIKKKSIKRKRIDLDPLDENSMFKVIFFILCIWFLKNIFYSLILLQIKEFVWNTRLG